MNVFRFLKYSLPFFFLFISFYGHAQTSSFNIHSIALPPELSNPANEFSCLNIQKGRLYLMAESRILDKQEAKIYSIKLPDLENFMADSTHALQYQKHPIIGLDVLVHKMLLQGDTCEGLEAMVLKGRQVYLSVETTTGSPWCYLLKGKWKNGKVYLDTNILLPVWKPRKPNGDAIYNASFECMEFRKGKLFAFFEYNYFEGDNYVYCFNKNLDSRSKDSLKISRIPYRITDIKSVGKNNFMAINSFYKGGGKDTINRPSITDTISYKLVHNGSAFHDYTRLINIHFNGKDFQWKTIFEMPAVYEGFNWEGIAPYKKGYFLVNDKYTTTKPYYSTLFYLQPN